MWDGMPEKAGIVNSYNIFINYTYDKQFK